MAKAITEKRDKRGAENEDASVDERALEEAPQSMPERLLDMQRRAGNNSVNAFVQTKLLVGPADDSYEREADAFASKVVGHDGGGSAHGSGGADAGFAASGELASYVHAGGGAALPTTLRRKMEPTFGLDFSDVRVHADAKAASMADGIGARAFTHGNDVYFGQGAYNPGSPSGEHLLAHELTHVLQQTGSAQRKISRKFDGSKTPTRLAQRRIQGNFFKTAKSVIKEVKTTAQNLTGKSKEQKSPEVGDDKLKSKSKPELQSYMARTKGGGPSENPDWSNPKFFGQEPDGYKVKLAVAQEDANWLKNAKELRNVGIKTALSSKGRKQLLDKEADREAILSKKVLEQRGDLDGLTDAEIKTKVDEFSDGIHNVGHTWVRLETYVGGEVKDLYSYGMWPAKVAQLNKPDDNWGGYGEPHTPGAGEVRHPDNMHEGDADKAYFTHKTKKAQFNKALAMAGERYASPPPYVLLGYNCTAFAKEIFQEAGGSYPSKGRLLPGFAYTPGNLYAALAKKAESEGKNKKAPAKSKKTAKEDEHKDLIGKIKAKQEMLSDSGVRDTQSELFAVPDDDAKTKVMTFYSGREFRFGQRPDFAKDSKTTLSADKQMTAVDNPGAKDRWKVATFWLGPKKYMYVPTKDVDIASKAPKKVKAPEEKQGGSGPQLQLYNGTGGGFHKPADTDAPNRTADLSQLVAWKIENREGEWINIANLRSGEYFWCKETHYNYFKDPGKVPMPVDLGGPKPKDVDDDEGAEPMVSTKGIPIYNTMAGMKAIRLLPTSEAKFLTYDQMNDDWRVVPVDGNDVYVREEDFTMWKMITGFKG